MSSHENNNKPSYDENIFFISIPAMVFLIIATLVMVISVKEVKPSKDPFPEPVLTVEESAALIAPRKSEASGGGSTTAANAVSDEGLTLISKSDCTACHKDSIKVVGPAYADIAAKYKGDKEASKKLIEKIKVGGSGNWGDVAMPPHPTMKDEEIEKMVKYILSLKGGKAPEPIAKTTTVEKSASVDSSNPKVAEALKFMKEKSDCLVCHKESEKFLGPSFVEIAQKYASDKEAPKNLTLKVKNGGQGVWGQTPMLPHPNLTEEEISNLVSAILTYNKVAAAGTGTNPSNEFSATFEAMKTKTDCYVCHKDKEAFIAPSFLEISKKYKDAKDIKVLVEKVKNGGTGVWGQTPMIPHPNLTVEEIEKMVKAILTVQ